MTSCPRTTLFHALWNAVAFLSRVTPPPPYIPDANPLASAVPFFPLTGLLLAGIATLPLLFVPPLLPWLYPLVLAWLTRGLHWDGLADLADACGSNAQGARFWEILKDSRVGAFGVMALFFGIIGQCLAVSLCLSTQCYAPLFLAPMLGRAAPLVLGEFVTPHPASTLAALIHPGFRTCGSRLAVAISILALLVFCTFRQILVFAALATLCIVWLVRLARQHGGCNGDFYGTAILLTETAVLLLGSLHL